MSARAVSQARDAVAGCDLVVTATAAKAPVFDGAWLEPGTHVSGVGANAPAKRELDATTLRSSRIVVDFREQVLQEAGDIQEALKSGAIQPEGIYAELGEVVTGAKPGRIDDRRDHAVQVGRDGDGGYGHSQSSRTARRSPPESVRGSSWTGPPSLVQPAVVQR